MKLTFGELRAEARTQLDDFESPGAGDSSNSLWSNAELDRYANEALEEACLRAHLARESRDIDVAAEENTYGLDGDITRIFKAQPDWRSPPLDQIGYAWLDRYRPGWRTHDGTPDMYVHDVEQDEIVLSGKPTKAGVLTLTVAFIPAKITNDATALPIREAYHWQLVWWIKKLAYSKRDSETYDPTAAKAAEAEFERVFGRRPTASQQERQVRGYPRRVTARYF